ncbi:ubiquitin carboxyl-terminal hydrolase 16-like isoform X2 [Saccostrea cucullata]|uniref:ubiquitin carboxyl-terminal hydrolase 16-like isoform X2 n=1 Tax=Saccostrea cuccullata TaxID=36930 RepID=UPI002ECFE34C
MEPLSIILLCVFIPVIVLLILCLLCLSLYWKKKWKSRNISTDLEAHTCTEIVSKFEDERKSKVNDEEAQIPLMALGESDSSQHLNTNQENVIDTTASKKFEEPRTKSYVHTKEISLQTVCPESIDKYTQTIYTVENEGTQTDEAEPLNVMEFDPPKGNKNLGNTCFFNSALQALYFTKSFKDALTTLKKSSSTSDSMKLTKRMFDLLEKKNVNHTQELRGVLNAVRSINNQFGRGTQEDSYELLNTLLDGIFNELRTASEKGTLQSKDLDSDNKGVGVKNLFTGLFIVIYVYDSCSDVEVDFEEFTSLSIPIVEQVEHDFDKSPHHGLQTISTEEPCKGIDKGLAVLTQIEEYEESDLPCRVCTIEGSGKSYRRLLVFQPPPVLVIHIDRFTMNDSNRLTKNTKCVQYPRRFNMAKFCSVANKELSANGLFYELYAVVVHSGALGGGHYYAYVNTTRRHDVKIWQEHLNRSTGDVEKLKSTVQEYLMEKRDLRDNSRYLNPYEVKDNWFYVSDNNVRSTNIGEVLCHKDAYILFYEVQ